jgi:hypothetical protein
MMENAKVKGVARRETMKSTKTLEGLEREFERLKAGVLKLGPVLQGNILPRTVAREDPRRPGRLRQYGPYYQWTRKVGGRTVNVNLSASQARAYGRAIAQHRRLEVLLERMRKVSLKILETSTEGVKKRKPRKTNESALS